MTTEIRGIRNNNPGNIDFNKANNWQGQLGIEQDVPNPRFARFDCPENGIRALGKLLQTYSRKYGLNTVRGLISRWAPSNENNTSAYVKGVANDLGVGADEVISVTQRETLKGLVIAIIKHENGKQPYSDFVINEGVNRALS